MKHTIPSKPNSISNPFFSIITASLNNESTISNTIKSVQKQCFKNLEHIIIDGKSSDKTLDILHIYQNTYNLKWISEPDSGIADALNKGLKVASGKYILILQADDQLFSNNILNKVYSILENETFDIYSFPIIFEHPLKGHTLHKPIRILWWNHFKFIFFHQGCFVRKELFDQTGGFDTQFRINLDYDFFYRALDLHASVNFQEFPIAIMGGSGIGSDPRFVRDRILEERMVHKKNEKNIFWKLLQNIFSFVHLPNKIRLSKIN